MEPPAVPSTKTRRKSEASPIVSPTLSSNSHSKTSTPSTSVPSTPVIPARPHSPERSQRHGQEPNSFLTALAAQERRVLELKEELQRAEADLEKLKKQWAAQEASRKRNEARQVEPMRSLKSSALRTSTDEEDSKTAAIRALDRRKTMSSHSKTSQRKVFAGSRHVRALSLLSTNTSNKDGITSLNSASDVVAARSSLDTSSTLSSLPELDTSSFTASPSKDVFKSPDKDMILETGRQLVGDFRQGFWTFVEDLKQVTVGDESSTSSHGRNAPGSGANQHGKSTPRSKTNRGQERTPETAVKSNAEKDILRDMDTAAPGKRGSSVDQKALASSLGSKQLNKGDERSVLSKAMTRESSPFAVNTAMGRQYETIEEFENDGWDNWDTPEPKNDNVSSKKSVASSPLSDLSSSRANISKTSACPKELTIPSTSSNGALPWPVLSSLSPSKLTKTASTLMSEWEKSLAIPAPVEESSQSLDGGEANKV